MKQQCEQLYPDILSRRCNISRGLDILSCNIQLLSHGPSTLSCGLRMLIHSLSTLSHRYNILSCVLNILSHRFKILYDHVASVYYLPVSRTLSHVHKIFHGFNIPFISHLVASYIILLPECMTMCNFLDKTYYLASSIRYLMVLLYHEI